MAKDAIYIVITFILVIIGGFLVFDRIETEEEMVVEEPEVVEVDTREAIVGSFETEIDSIQSVLGWQAEKTVLTTHVNTGTLNLSSGSLVFEDGKLAGGEFVVDMESLAVTSVHGGEPAVSGGSSLLRHVSGEDFFDVSEYPEVTFVITEVDVNTADFSYDAKGELTIKDITNEIKFPVEIYKEDGRVVVEGAVSVDRTEWEITYGSGSFFEDLGDKVIKDSFDVDILLFAPFVEEVETVEDTEEDEEESVEE